MRGGLINRGGCLCSSQSKQLDSWNEEIVEYNNKESDCVTVEAFILKGSPETEGNVSTRAAVRNKCYYVKNQFLARDSVMLLISICVLCLEGLSSALWASWVFDVGEGNIVLVTVALKCISNVSLSGRLPGESLEVRTRTPQLVFSKCGDWVRFTIKTHLLRGSIPIGFQS